MESDVQIVRRPQEETQLVEVDEAPEQVNNPLLTAHRLLHGKYPIVITFALIGFVLATAVTYKVVKDSYTSTGMIQISPTVPIMLYHNDYNGELQQYDNFVETQAQLVMTEAVMDDAVQDPDYVALLGRASTADDSAALLAATKVTHEKGEIISIGVSDPNPQRPAVAANAIIKAYLKRYSNVEEDNKNKTIEDLQKIKETDTIKVNTNKKRILEIAKSYGVTDLQQAIELKNTEVSQITNDLRRVQMDLIIQGNPTGAVSTSRPSELNPDNWRQNDPQMKELVNQRVQAELRLQALRDGGLMEGNPKVKAAEDEVAAVDQQIIKFSQSDNENYTSPQNSVAGLLRQQEALTKMLVVAKADQADLSQKNISMKSLVDETASMNKELEEVSTRLNGLVTESYGHGRISAVSYGTRPILDSAKRKLIALAGGGGGAGLVVASFLLMGLANRRMRHIADIHPDAGISRNLRLLGAVPMLGADGSMGDNTPAAQSVHRIRTRLQIEAAKSDRRVLTVTSPASGNGKTSVITALGMSFASSGSKVLLIDCDLVGAGLTARLNGRVRRNIVDILRSQTHVTEDQLAQAARVANKSSDRFLQALIEFEFLSSDEVKRAVTTHKESNLGLLDAMNGEPLNHCVAATRWPRLFVLPRGGATGSDAAQLSPLALRRLFHQARNSYDVVLIDTGPLFGSIEATLAASESDGTVLIVSRGESAAAVQAADTDLKSMNCKVMGIVFNRAKASDVASYGYSSKSYERSRPVASLTDGGETNGEHVSTGRNGESRAAMLKKMA